VGALMLLCIVGKSTEILISRTFEEKVKKNKKEGNLISNLFHLSSDKKKILRV